MTGCLYFIADKIYQWLSAPDSSKNYNDARKKHQKGTCSWFLDGKHFREFQEKADFLWIKGKGTRHNANCQPWAVLNDDIYSRFWKDYFVVRCESEVSADVVTETPSQLVHYRENRPTSQENPID
jgi:hypothetical protein